MKRRVKSHAAHLDSMTVIENYDRRFIRSKTIKDVDDSTRTEILQSKAHFSLAPLKLCFSS